MLCTSPQFIKQVQGLVPCGKCFHCRINRRREWTFRLVMESLVSSPNSWWLLTYSDDMVPYEYVRLTDGCVFDCEGGRLPTLNPDHVTLFLKRLRHYVRPRKFRYFLCGEYGETTYRPHYHLCLFGLGKEVEKDVQTAWADVKARKSLGFASYSGVLSRENIQYTCGYTVKKMTRPDDLRLRGRYPEFVRHSVGIGRPAIDKICQVLGLDHLKAHMLSTADYPRKVVYGGKEWPIDRYMRNKLHDYFKEISPVVKEVGRDRYEKEMQTMLTRAQNRAFRSSPHTVPSKAFLLTSQYAIDNAQRLRNSEAAAKLFNQKGESL